MDALQIKTGAEGRAEGRQRQHEDGERIVADMLDQLTRHQRAERDAEQHQHGLGNDRRQRQFSAADGSDAAGDHCAGDKSARQIGPQKKHAAGGADGERFQDAQQFGAAGQGRGKRSREQGHAALWQIRFRRTNALMRCSNAGDTSHPATPRRSIFKLQQRLIGGLQPEVVTAGLPEQKMNIL